MEDVDWARGIVPAPGTGPKETTVTHGGQWQFGAVLCPCLRCVAVALLAGAALAAGPAAGSEIAERTRLFVEGLALPGADVEIVVGEVDPRQTLAPCRRYEPFVPTGARLWGRTTLGVRCTEGATWTAYVPMQIKVFAEAPVAARPIARGETLTSEDVRQERVELSAYPTGAFAGVAAEGRIATRAIAAGEPLRRDLLRSPPVVQAGDLVRVIADGNGFAIATDGKALTAGTDGQTVQVAVASGRVVTGTARPGRIVAIR